MKFYKTQKSDFQVSLSPSKKKDFSKNQISSLLEVLIFQYESGNVVNVLRNFASCPLCNCLATYTNSTGAQNKLTACQVIFFEENFNILIPSLMIHDLQVHEGQKDENLTLLLSRK